MTTAIGFLPKASLARRAEPWLQAVGVLIVGLAALTAAIGVAAHNLPETVDERGAIEALELATLETSAESEAREAALDAPEQPQQPAPHLEEVKAEKAREDRPQEQASIARPLEDLRMAQEQTRETIEKAEPEQQSSERQEETIVVPPASQATVAVEASDVLAGRPDDKSAAPPDIGSAQHGERRMFEWQKQLFSHIGRNKFYPDAARKQNRKGEVVVAFSLDADGRIDDVRIARSSGSKALDDAAIETMRRSNPAPKPPAGGPAMRLELPMRFALK